MQIFILIMIISDVAKGGLGPRGYSPPHWLFFYIVLKYLNLFIDIFLHILIRYLINIFLVIIVV